MEPAGRLVKNLIYVFERELSGAYRQPEIRQFVYLLFEEYLGWQKARVHLSFDVVVPGQAMESFNMALAELCAGKPIQYVLGKTWFNGSLLQVGPGVLIPRPETEELCAIIKAECAGDQDSQLSVLDIGTGSGCIAIDLKKQFPHWEVTAIDNSKNALEIAATNAASNNCRVSFIQANILDPEAQEKLPGYHVIVSNPPYVLESERLQMHRNVTDFEPGTALFVTDNDPLVFYRAIAAFAEQHLYPGGRLWFEINEKFGKEVCGVVRSAGFGKATVLKDFHGKDRFVSAVSGQ